MGFSADPGVVARNEAAKNALIAEIRADKVALGITDNDAYAEVRPEVWKRWDRGANSSETWPRTDYC